MDKKIKVGIVGFGKMGMLHGGLLGGRDDVELTAITDTSAMVLRAFKSLRPEIKYYRDYEKMIDENDLDAIVIATPSFNHVTIAKYALDKNIHLFIEKPLSNNLKSAQELWEIIKDKPVKSMVGFCLRYMPTIAKAKQMLDRGELGQVKKVKAFMHICDVLSPQKGWRYDPAIAGGGVVMDFTVHMIDLISWYFGQPKTIEAKTHQLYSTAVEDEAEIELEYDNGLKINIESSWSKPEHRKSFAKIVIQGEKGILEVTDQTLLWQKDGEEKPQKIYYPELYEGYYLDIGGPNYSTQMEKFIEAVKNNQMIEMDINQALITQKMVDDIYRSATTNQKVIINI